VDDGIVVEITPCSDVEHKGGATDVSIRVEVPVHSAARRAPVDVVCCIDVSGSMSTMAEYEDVATGRMTHDGIDLLGIVKHACKAAMFSLDEYDRFSLVTFDHESEIRFPLTGMTDANKALHSLTLDKIHT